MKVFLKSSSGDVPPARSRLSALTYEHVDDVGERGAVKMGRGAETT